MSFIKSAPEYIQFYGHLLSFHSSFCSKGTDKCKKTKIPSLNIQYMIENGKMEKKTAAMSLILFLVNRQMK